MEGHGGGDAGLMDAFTGAVATGNRELIMSWPRESLASYLAVFAAERARLNGTVEPIPPHAGQTNALSRTDAGDSPGTQWMRSRSTIQSRDMAAELFRQRGHHTYHSPMPNIHSACPAGLR